MFEITRNGVRLPYLFQKTYGNRNKRRVVKTLFDYQVAEINKASESKRVCILKPKHQPGHYYPSSGIEGDYENHFYSQEQTNVLYRNKKTGELKPFLIDSRLDPEEWEYVFKYPRPKYDSRPYGFGLYILPENPSVGEIFYIEELIEYLSSSFTNHWSDEYMYADIEARWNGEELEYIAFPYMVIG